MTSLAKDIDLHTKYYSYKLPCGNKAIWYSNMDTDIKHDFYYYCDGCMGKLGKNEISKKCQSLIDQQRTLDILARKMYYDINGYLSSNNNTRRDEAYYKTAMDKRNNITLSTKLYFSI